MRTWEEVNNLARTRQRNQDPLIREWERLRDYQENSYTIPLIGVNGEPIITPPAQNLLLEAVENTALRAASISPNVACPALNPYKEKGYGSRENAEARRTLIYSAWEASQINMLIRRGYRQLCTYGTKSWLVEYDKNTDRARIKLMDPLNTFPNPQSQEDYYRPLDVIYIYPKSQSFVRANYSHLPGVETYLADCQASEMIDLALWIDEDQYMLGILGSQTADKYSPGNYTSRSYSREYGVGVLLKTWENPLGYVPAYTSRRITLNRIYGSIANLVGPAMLHGELSALQYWAIRQNINNDKYLLAADPNQPIDVNGGRPWAPGESGEINQLRNVSIVGQLQTNIPQDGFRMASEIERNVRIASGNPGIFSGELNGSIRSGQTVSQLGAYSVDAKTQELQEIMALGLEYCNSAVVDLTKTVAKKRVQHFYTGKTGTPARIEVNLDKQIDSNLNKVTYPLPGADAPTAAVTINTMVATGLMSRRTGRYKHPFIDSPEAEERQVVREELEMNMLEGIKQQGLQGIIPPADIAEIYRSVEEGESLADAIISMQRKAQERQAQQAPPPQEGQVASPEMMPGLAMPGMGAEMAPPPSIPQSPDGLSNLAGLVRNLRARPAEAPQGV